MDASDQFCDAASIILELNTTSWSLLLDTSSPQYNAVQWLSEEDGFTVAFTRDVSKQELSVRALLKGCGHAWGRRIVGRGGTTMPFFVFVLLLPMYSLYFH
jgi:hypothetical protein